MSKLTEDENVIASSKDEEKISDEALAIMQKSFADIDKLQNIDTKEDVPDEVVETEISNEETLNPEDTENIVEEIEVKKEKSLSKQNKIRKLQNDRFRALASEREALKRVEELEGLLDEALHSGTYHYSKNIHSDIDRAKQKMELAIEEGDSKAFTEANVELAEAIHAANDLKRWNVRDRRSAEIAPVRNVEPDYATITQEIAQDWLEYHPYLQPGSREYNPTLARQVDAFTKRLDEKLMRNNEMDLYFSEDYFNAIDAFIDENRKKTHLTNGKSGTSNNHIGGVRHSNSGSLNGGRNDPKRIELSADEKAWCINSGMSEKRMIEIKLEELKEAGKR